MKRLFLLSFVAVFALVAAGFFGLRQVAQSSDTEGVSATPKAIANAVPSQDPSFSVERNGPSGLSPADIFKLGPVLQIGCPGLGLNVPPLADCNPGVNQDNVNSLSYGADWKASAKAGYHLFFSVAPGSLGLAGTAVAGEAGCPTAEPEADEFGSAGFGTNFQMFDGDGSDCGAGNAGGPVGLLEAQAAQPPNDDMDALDEFLEPQIAPGLVWFTLDPASPSLGPLMASPADILVVPANGGVAPWIYANAAALGLAAGDVIDALCLQDYDDIYSGFEPIWFSLEKNSPTLTANGWSGADILAAPPMMPVSRVVTANQLGLATSDDLNALKCLYEVPETDKEVIEVRFDDALAYPYEGEPLPDPFEVPLGLNFKISVTSVEVNHGPWVPEDAMVNFYADIPLGCQGRWVVDPDVNIHDTLTVGGDPFAEPMTPAQMGDMVSPTYPKVPGDEIEGTFESDLHFQTLDYGIEEPIYDPEDPTTLVPITRFFEIICLESSSHVFTFCNKIEAKLRIDNDGDGLIDEDPIDGIDNDDDGLWDEDPPEPMNDPNFANNVMCVPLQIDVIAYADKEVEDIEFDDGDGTPLPDHDTKTDQAGFSLQVLYVPASENHMISVTSYDLNNGPDPVADALVNFYADIPTGCEGRWVVDPAGANPYDTRTVEGDPYAPPFDPLQLGTTVPEDDPKEEGGYPWFESDLHYQTADYGLDEPPYTGFPHTRFFELHCADPGQYHFNFCNKIEGKHTIEPDPDPHPNLLCQELVVEAYEPPEPHYECYLTEGWDPPYTVDLETQFGTEYGLDVGYAWNICPPAVKTDLEGSHGTLDASHLRCFEFENWETLEPPGYAVNLTDQFGSYENVEVGPPYQLCVPSSKEVVEPYEAFYELPTDPHYKCYMIEEYHEAETVDVETQFVTPTDEVTVYDPVLLCVPTIKTVFYEGEPVQGPVGSLDPSDLVCYGIEGATPSPTHTIVVETQFAFEEAYWEVYGPSILCIPAEKEVVGPELPEEPSFSIQRNGPSARPGGSFDPADILTYGPTQAVLCPNLGLGSCNGGDDIDALSVFGDWDQPAPDGLHWLAFSVVEKSVGAAGTAVSGEYGCIGNLGGGPEPEADEFDSKTLKDNQQVFDGDGVACDGNAGITMNLVEPAGDDFDALDDDAAPTAGPYYFSLDPTSPSAASAADIYVSFGAGDIAVYAAAAALSLDPDLDDIDALCISDETDEYYFQPTLGDYVAFSLAAGSKSLGTWGVSPADVLITNPAGAPLVYRSAQQLGLNPDFDDLNALKCYQEQSFPDNDGNTLPDQWEAQQWCNTIPPGLFTGGDWDGDTLTDDTEFGIGTDPCVVDTDGDGCADSEEPAATGGVGTPGSTGDYNPLFYWDYYDVPVPANPDPTANGTKNGAINMGDVGAVLFYVPSSPNGVCQVGDQNAMGVDYDCDKDSNGTVDGLEYDRSSSPAPNPPWDAGPPSGAVNMGDVGAVLAQVPLSCTNPP